MPGHASHICKICRTVNDTEGYRVKEMMFGFRDEFLYFQCKNCECLQISTFPENISKYYPRHYYSLKKYEGEKFKGIAGKVRKLTLPSAVFRKTIWDKFISMLFPHPQFHIFNKLNVSKHTRILDVGCGSGYKFLYPLAETGFHSLTGCDPYIKNDLFYENGLRIFKMNIFGIDHACDLITYHHSFEHLEQPAGNLKKVRELLSDNGICIIRTPTVSSYAWRHYKTNWFQIDAPRHYFIPSIKTMKYLAKEAGLELKKVIYDSTYKQFSESERYARNKPLRQARKKGIIPFLKRKIKKIAYAKKAKQLNKEGRGDQAAFFLVKK